MQAHVRRPLPIDRAAVLLIRRFGDDCAIIARRRMAACLARGDHLTALEWELVLRRVVELHFAEPPRLLN